MTYDALTKVIRVVWAGGVASLAAVAVRVAAGVQGGPPSGWIGAVVEALVPFASATGFGGVLGALAGMLATVVLAITVLLGMLLVGPERSVAAGTRPAGAGAHRRAIVADGSVWSWLVLTLGSSLLVSPIIGAVTLVASTIAAFPRRPRASAASVGAVSIDPEKK